MEYLTLLFGFTFGFIFALVALVAYLFVPDDFYMLFFKRRDSLKVEKINISTVLQGLSPDLKKLLMGPEKLEALATKEPCIAISLMLQFLFQEFRNSKSFKRWILKKLQIDFNELMSRNAIGSKVIKDIKIDRLDIGRQPPVIKGVGVSNFTLSEHDDSFEDPVIEFNVDPKFRGRPLPHLVAVIMAQVRRTIRKRHVFPAYKLRFRPLLQNPLLMPSSDPDLYTCIDIKGYLKITVLNCTRLNLSALPDDHDSIFCAVSTAEKPYTTDSTSTEYVTVAVKLTRRNGDADIGLIVSSKFTDTDRYSRKIVATFVKENSAADKAGFKIGDKILAVNNIAITTDRQAMKLLNNTLGDIVTIVERSLKKSSEKENDGEVALLTPTVCGPKKLSANEEDKEEHVVEMRSKKTDLNTLKMTYSLTDLHLRAKHENFEQLRNSSECHTTHQKATVTEIRKTHSACLISEKCTVDSGNYENTGPETSLIIGNSAVASTASESAEKHIQTRRQRLTERAWLVAHKLSSSKTSMKQVMAKRVKSATDNAGLAPSAAYRVRHLSESDEDLSTDDVDSLEPKVCAEDGIEQISMLNLQSRRRCKSTSNLSEDQPAIKLEVPKFTLDCPAPESDKERTEKFAIEGARYDEKSKYVKLKRDVNFDQRFKIPLDSRFKYIVLRVYSQSSARETENAHPYLLGYVSLLLPEVLDDCSSTNSLCIVQSYILRPSGTPRTPPLYRHLSTHAGFDSRLCYGDITLKFHWLPTPHTSHHKSESDEECKPVVNLEQSAMTNATTAFDEHLWDDAHFPRGTACDVCQRKIWLKWGLKCSKCGMACHKKCVNRTASAPVLRKCGEIFETMAREKLDSDNVINTEAMEACEATDMPFLDNKPISLTSSQVNHRSYGRKFLSDKIAGLSRRKKQIRTSSDLNVEIPATPASSPTYELKDFEKERTPLDHAELGPELKAWPTMLYTKCGTYNEHMIYAAKELGKDLFSDLAPTDRKNKINEQIDLLQRDIDETVEKRLDLLTQLKSPHLDDTSKIKLEIATKKLDEQLQTLAILMLHYCAGLQNCIEIEDSAPINSNPCQSTVSNGVQPKESAFDPVGASDALTNEVPQSSDL